MIDTGWEAFLEDLERQELLAWASALAEQDQVLAKGVSFIEEPLAVRWPRVMSYSKSDL